MRRIAHLTLPLVFLFFAGCADQPTAPDDIQPQFAKPVCPGPHPSCGPDDPGGGGDQANPVIAFDAGNHRKKGGLWVVDADGGNKTQIYNLGGGQYFRPSWSPLHAGTEADPHEILFTACCNVGVGKLRLFVNDDGKVERMGGLEILSPDVNYVQVSTSPDGLDVAVVWRPIDGSSRYEHLMLTNPETFSPVVTLYTTEIDFSIRAPAWSWDGTHIAFMEARGSFPEEGYALKILDLSGGEPTTAYTFTPVDFGPVGLSWARGSDRVVFDYDGEMYLLELEEDDEGNLVAVPGGAEMIGPGFGPVWSPDDAQIAYDTRAGVYVKTLIDNKPDLPVGGQWFSDWRRDPLPDPGPGGGE